MIIFINSFSKFGNVTSTVKKVNPIKANVKILSDKVNSMLCEEMVITKDDKVDHNLNRDDAGNQAKVVVKAQLNEITNTAVTNAPPDFALKLVYYLQDGTEVSVWLL